MTDLEIIPKFKGAFHPLIQSTFKEQKTPKIPKRIAKNSEGITNSFISSTFHEIKTPKNCIEKKKCP